MVTILNTDGTDAASLSNNGSASAGNLIKDSDTKSFATHPATTTHRVIGEAGRKILNISDDMIRLSIGLEDVDDLVEDIESALKTT